MNLSSWARMITIHGLVETKRNVPCASGEIQILFFMLGQGDVRLVIVVQWWTSRGGGRYSDRRRLH